MKPLVRAEIIPLTDAQYAANIKSLMAEGMTRSQAKACIAESMKGECYKNDVYTVIKREADGLGGVIVHLSIRRNDRRAQRDWRDFQAIKDQLLGPEEEAVEIYPAQSRLVDTANQFHLWSMRGAQVPFGFRERHVLGNDAVRGTGAVQRELPNG